MVIAVYYIGVNLLGINSVLLPHELRLHVWERLASDIKPRHTESIVTRTIGLNDLPGVFDEYLAGTVTGRTLVKISDD